MFAKARILSRGNLVFPPARGSKRQYYLTLLPPLGVALLGAVSLTHQGLYELFVALGVATILLYALTSIGLVLHALFMEQSTHIHGGRTILSLGTALATLSLLVPYVLPGFLLQEPGLGIEHAALPVVVLPVSVVYATLRRDMAHVPLRQRWLAHAALWMGLFCLYALVLYANDWLLAWLSQPISSLVSMTLFMLLMGVSFNWVHEHFRYHLNRLVFKDSYDYSTALQSLSRELSLAGDLKALEASLPTRLRQLMNSDFALVLLYDQHKPYVHGVCGNYEPEIFPALIGVISDLCDTPHSVMLPASNLTVLIVPLRLRDEVVGHLCLGPKRNGEPFRKEDADLLATLSGQIAATVHNTQLIEELREKVCALDALNERLQCAQEEERARIAADIHDEPLQTAIQLQRQIAMSSVQDESTRIHAELSKTLVNQLRTICTAMRPPVLDDLGLYAALDALAQEQSARGGVPILWEVDTEMAEMVLPPAVELMLYRTAQEAVSNALRHAAPSVVQIKLQCHGKKVQMQIVDDGVGFVVPSSFDLLVLENHLGLAGLHNRVQRTDGSFSVSSRPGAGTTVQVDLDLEDLR